MARKPKFTTTNPAVPSLTLLAILRTLARFFGLYGEDTEKSVTRMQRERLPDLIIDVARLLLRYGHFLKRREANTLNAVRGGRPQKNEMVTVLVIRQAKKIDPQFHALEPSARRRIVKKSSAIALEIYGDKELDVGVVAKRVDGFVVRRGGNFDDLGIDRPTVDIVLRERMYYDRVARRKDDL